MRKNTGNSWNPDIIYNCRECGVDNLCDVCHEHDMPRGDCDKCPEGDPELEDDN